MSNSMNIIFIVIVILVGIFSISILAKLNPPFPLLGENSFHQKLPLTGISDDSYDYELEFSLDDRSNYEKLILTEKLKNESLYLKPEFKKFMSLPIAVWGIDCDYELWRKWSRSLRNWNEETVEHEGALHRKYKLINAISHMNSDQRKKFLTSICFTSLIGYKDKFLGCSKLTNKCECRNDAFITTKRRKGFKLFYGNYKYCHLENCSYCFWSRQCYKTKCFRSDTLNFYRCVLHSFKRKDVYDDLCPVDLRDPNPEESVRFEELEPPGTISRLIKNPKTVCVEEECDGWKKCEIYEDSSKIKPKPAKNENVTQKEESNTKSKDDVLGYMKRAFILNYLDSNAKVSGAKTGINPKMLKDMKEIKEKT